MYEDVMAADRPAQRPACLLEFADEVGTFQGGYYTHQVGWRSIPYPPLMCGGTGQRSRTQYRVAWLGSTPPLPIESKQTARWDGFALRALRTPSGLPHARHDRFLPPSVRRFHMTLWNLDRPRPRGAGAQWFQGGMGQPSQCTGCRKDMSIESTDAYTADPISGRRYVCRQPFTDTPSRTLRAWVDA
jgi:hypothetical protein